MRTLKALAALAIVLTSFVGVPGAEAASTVRLPAPVRIKLPNGITLLVVNRPELPMVAIDAVVRAGSVNDPAGKAGLASLTADLLKRGTTTRSAPQIAETIDAVGGTLSTGAGADTASAGVAVLTKDVDLGLSLMADVLQHPAFKPEELKKLKEEEVAGLKSSLDDANAVVKRAARQAILAGNPYGRPTTLSSVGGIQVQDVRAFYDGYYKPNNTLVAVVGDITPEVARAKLTKAFGGWKAGPVKLAPVPALKPITGRKVVLVDMDVSQSFIMLGHPGVKRNNPDYFPLLVLNFILGGDFTSRLNMSIRDKQGLAYGAGSAFTMYRDAGYFTAHLNTRTATTAKALDSLLVEIRGIQGGQVTAEELGTAKAYLTGSFPLRFETNGQLASEIVNMEIHGLPADYLSTYRDRVSAVTPADVQRVAKQYLHPGDYDLVVVTKAKEVRSALGPFGTVEVWPKERLIN
ncbi:MAG: putative Zn-dependent peptidase family [Cyanobacteria bacterium RYN_339]|nr:putative Zn-dependent peptidase family [Cyanobacteria bacterium RYN_339]